MQWLAEKNTGYAKQIWEMFMPRKVFDDELRRDRLSCREAAVVTLPPPASMTHAAGGSLSNAPWNNISYITYDKSTAFTVLML